MSLHQTLQVFELFDSALIDGQQVVDLFAAFPGVNASFKRVSGPKGRTDFIHIDIPGAQGKAAGGSAPTLGIIGRPLCYSGSVTPVVSLSAVCSAAFSG